MQTASIHCYPLEFLFDSQCVLLLLIFQIFQKLGHVLKLVCQLKCLLGK